MMQFISTRSDGTTNEVWLLPEPRTKTSPVTWWRVRAGVPLTELERERVDAMATEASSPPIVTDVTIGRSKDS